MYQRSEYTSRRDDDHDRDRNEGGWRSWFGLNKNKDEDRDRDYHYARTTTYRNDDRDNYSRDYYNRDRDNNVNRDYNVTRTATYVRDDDRDRSYGYGGRLGTDTRGAGGYGYQTSGESNLNRGYGQSYGQSYGGSAYDRDNRGWSSNNDRDRTSYAYNDGSRFTTGGDAYARGGYQSSSTTYDRPTYGGDYNRTTTYRGYGDNDRDTNRGYSYTSRSNW